MKKKILLIEDNSGIRKSVTQLLELADYEVKAVQNGKEGVDAAIKEIPDLIICDIAMPELDGYGVLLLLSKNSKTAHVPFIFITAKTDRADFRKGMEMGAEDFITKPFDDVELLNAIEARFKKKELLKKEFASGMQSINAFLNQAKSSEGGELKLTENREVKFFSKKQIIYKQGFTPQCLYYVNKGKVKTYKLNNDAKELITAIYKEGDFMGYRVLLEDILYLDNAEAMEDAELMIIPKEEFISLINRDIQLAKKFIKMLSKDVAEKEEQLLSLAYNSLRKRIANGLLLVYNTYKKEHTDKPALEISREDLAQVVGTATESIIRTLSDFKTEKLIEIKEGKISILDEAKLRSLQN